MINDNENNLFAKLAFDDLNEVQALLQSGANVDAQDEYGSTALFNALFLEDLKRAKLLFEYNASPNIKNNNGATLLHTLVICKSIESIKFLFENANNIDLEIKDINGFTPLYSAILDENIAAMELLLQFGADANSKDNYEIPALHCAIINNKLKAAELLIKSGGDVNAQDNGGWTLLYSSVFNKIEAAKLLIKYGADVNVGSDNNFIPLDNAIIGQQKELAELFLKSGANITTDMGLLHSKILDLLNMNVSAEVIANLLLTSNTIPDNIKFNILSSTSQFTKDIHRKVIDNHLKDARKEWSKNGITEESFHNNKFKDIIKTYKEYKDFAIDYREKCGAPCLAFEDYNNISAEGLIIPKPTEFAEEIESLHNLHYSGKSLSYFAFKKLLSSHHNLEITQDNNITLYTTTKNTEQQVYIEYDVKNQKLKSFYNDDQTLKLTEVIWDNNNSESILANLFETNLTGEAA